MLGFALAGLLVAAAPPVDLTWGTSGDGTASDLWTRAIARQVGDAEAKRLAQQPLPIDAKQLGWGGLVMKEKDTFAAERAALDAPFGGNLGRVRILLGNRGERDAFSYDDDVIAINLAKLQEVYGDASEAQRERVRRILAHEYTHLLTRQLKRKDRLVETTPLDRTLWTLFDEGLAHYRSLSSRYKPLGPNRPSKDASVALAAHSEKLVGVLAALEGRPSEAEEKKLTEGMVTGAFDQKWGALPIALWLAAEVAQVGDEKKVLKRFIQGGPSSVLTLVRQHVGPDLAAKLPGTRAQVKAPKMKVMQAPEERSGLDALKRSR